MFSWLVFQDNDFEVSIKPVVSIKPFEDEITF